MERCSISTQIPCFYPRAREGYDRPRLGRTTTAARDFSPRARKLNDDVSAFSLPANPNSFNPHSHAGSDPRVLEHGVHRGAISPRTPHAGSDKSLCAQFNTEEISTRTPHAGSDRNIMRKIYCLDQHIAPIDKQGTRNKRVRHLYVTLFGANLTYVICELRARTMVLQCQEPFSFVRWLRTYMLNLRLIFASKTVESQTIFLRIDQLDELALDTNHRRSIGNAFEH